MPELKKTTRKQKDINSDAVDITDALYEKLSIGQQTLVITAEALGLVPKVATYEGRAFVDRVTCVAIYDAINA